MLPIFPLIGTIFCDQFDWGILDFLIMGFILVFVGIALMFVSQKIKYPEKRFFLHLCYTAYLFSDLG